MESSDYAAFPSFDRNPAGRRFNLWGYVDARDGAQAIRKLLEEPLKGEIGPNETLLSIDKARRALGYEPQYSWRKELSP
jgi:nucleoside-diphosphate-sugar epimerase